MIVLMSEVSLCNQLTNFTNRDFRQLKLIRNFQHYFLNCIETDINTIILAYLLNISKLNITRIVERMINDHDLYQSNDVLLITCSVHLLYKTTFFFY